MGPAQRGPWPGRAGLWGAGDWPCCDITGAGTGGPGELKWGPEEMGRLGVRGALRELDRDSQNWQCFQGHGNYLYFL